MTWLSAKEESALEEHLTAVGQRTARERILYRALFLYMRGKDTRLVKGQSLKISVTQAQIAETMGLSLIHTNRVMQNLRKSGIVVWNADEIKFADLQAAVTLAHYEHQVQQKRPYI